ncbi:hypothetical protein VTN31DRAFT_4943 [Thermomyces dupontii]|uniref:uncharacterized protein n=1 Tax=Talaromyces thermophilus TaxID=28565 RepID=UPI0037436723
MAVLSKMAITIEDLMLAPCDKPLRETSEAWDLTNRGLHNAEHIRFLEYLLPRVSQVEQVRIRVLLGILRDEQTILLQKREAIFAKSETARLQHQFYCCDALLEDRAFCSAALQDADFRVWVAHDPGVLRLGID